jgi:microcystin-dependent protein
MNPQDIYNSIKDLIKADIGRNIAGTAEASQYNVSKIPDHVHNGTDSSRISYNDLTNLPTISTGIPSGSITAYGGSVAPTGYLLCDGTAVSRTTYATLFGVTSTTYGVGDGSTTFNVPDLRANVPVGYKSGDTNFGTRSATVVGSPIHTLTLSQIPSHQHAGNYSAGVWNTNGANGTNLTNGSGTAPSVTPGLVPEGGGNSHNNIQASLVVNYIIKT